MANVNDIFAEFAGCFAGSLSSDGDDVVFARALRRDALDYSVESLKVVDDYLMVLHEADMPEELNRGLKRAVLWGGAYVGEVIRRNAPRRYDWINFDDFVEEFPETVKLLGPDKTLGTCALLTAGGGGFTLPINKVMRFIDDGPEDSVWFYASCEVRPEDPG